jgi:hypothetical protein
MSKLHILVLASRPFKRREGGSNQLTPTNSPTINGMDGYRGSM